VLSTVKSGFLALLTLLYFHNSSGQETEILDLLLNPEQESENGEIAWIENLWVLTQHPVNVNTASIPDLLQIPFLSPEIAYRIIRFRDKTKNFTSVEELYQIEGVTEELLKALTPFIYVGPVPKSFSIVYRFQSILEFPQRRGYLLNSYHNPFYLQQRILFKNIKNFKGGIIWEKDAGEDNLFDFGSFYLTYIHPKKKVHFTLGDFYKRVGVGLILGTPYGTSLSIHSLPNYRPFQPTFQGNQSTREVGFLRGIALEVRPLSQLSLEMFYSKNQWDANVSGNNETIKSIYFQGLHRTDSEKIKKKRLLSEIVGGSFSTNFRFFNLQSSVILQKFQPRLNQRDASLPYLSFAYHFNSDILQQGGEIALSEAKFPAIQQHLYFSQSRVKWELIGYYYHPAYFSALGHAFGSFQQSPGNTFGMAMVLQYRPAKTFLIGGYYHTFRQIHDIEENPYTRRDYMIEMHFNQKNAVILLQFKFKVYESETEIQKFADKIIRAVRLDYTSKFISNLNIRNRLQFHWLHSNVPKLDEISTNLYQQVEWKLSGWSFIGRWSTFDIPDYDLRIYEYENDLPGNFRLVLLNGRGYKIFFICRKKISEYLQIDLKYGQRYYPDQTSIGSGLDEISQNRVHDFRLSLNWRIIP
jgi:hypothetical protein